MPQKRWKQRTEDEYMDTGENDLFIDRENCQRSFNCQVSENE